MSIELVMSSNHLILCQPSSPPTLSLSWHQSLFQWVGSLHQVAKVLELQVQHQSNEYSGLISFRIDWFDLLAVQVTLKSLLQHHNSKASILQRSAFIMVQLYIHRWLMEKNHTFDFPNMPAEHCGDFWKEFLGWSSHMASIRMPDLLPRILWASGMLTFLPHPGLVCLKHK